MKNNQHGNSVPNNKTLTQELWPQAEFVSHLTGIALSAIVILIYSVIGILRKGYSEELYLLLILGSVLSVAGGFAYIMSSYLYGAAGKKGFLGMLLVFAGFAPWVFGTFVTLVPGVWGLISLISEFSIWELIKSLLAIVLGYKIVSGIHSITELDKKVAWISKNEDFVSDKLIKNSPQE